jgi:hypothetical protein
MQLDQQPIVFVLGRVLRGCADFADRHTCLELRERDLQLAIANLANLPAFDPPLDALTRRASRADLPQIRARAPRCRGAALLKSSESSPPVTCS